MNKLFNIPNKLIAVTGGIASGKTTFCKELEAEGKKVFYADKIVKKIYETRSVRSVVETLERQNFDPSLPADSKSFFVGFTRDDPGRIHFKNLRKYLFNNPIALDWMEEVIQDHFEGEFLKEYMGRGLYIPENFGEYSDIYLEHPLVYQRKLEDRFDEIILCEAPVEERVKRIIERDGCTEEVARLMIQRQGKFKDGNNS